MQREAQESRERMQTSRSHLALGVTSLRSSQQSLNDPGDMNNYMLGGGGDLYYNSRPQHQHNTGMSVSLSLAVLFAFISLFCY